MNTLSQGLPILAHFFIGLFFVFSGCWNIYHWVPILQVMVQKKIPHPYFILPIGITLQIIAGVMIICGIYIKIAAAVLIPLTVIVVFIFHPFWKFKGEQRTLNFTVFITNMTVTLGALLLLLS